GHTYHVYDNDMTWMDAKAYCERIGGHLVTITSQEENDIVAGILVGDYYFIGATDEAQEGTWQWENGESWSYSGWDRGEPNNGDGNQNHAAMYGHGNYDGRLGVWDDAWGTDSHGFVCEFDSLLEDGTGETGHTHTFTEEIIHQPTCTAGGSKRFTCSVCQYSFVQETDPLGHSMPEEWTEEIHPTVFAQGLNVKRCANCDHKETEIIPQIYIDITQNENYGLANFTVVDATTLVPISGVNILVSTETDGEGTLMTGYDGKVSAILPVGRQSLTVFANGYLTRNLTVRIKPGEQDIPLIGISVNPLVDVQITHHEMTLEEIEAAGIDTSDPANQHVFKYEIKLEFEAEVDWISLEAYFRPDGECIKFTTGDYHGPTGGGYYPGGGGGGGTGGGGILIPLPGGTTATVYPVSEKFFLIIHGEVRWLKEMYDVEMLVFNKSLTDTVEDCTAQLNIPEGLSLAAMRADMEQQSAKREIDYIAPGGTESIHWYLRGDTAGTYNITASLDGMLMPFEEEFHYEYEADSAIKVYAGSAMHMTIEVPGITYYNEDYPIRITLENVSHKPIYNISHAITGLKQCRVTVYSDGHIEEETYVDEGTVGSIRTEVFNPGDKMVIELTSNIMFQSELIRYNLEQLCGYVDQIETLYNAYNAVMAGANLISALSGAISGISANIDDVLDDIDLTPADKYRAYQKLGIAVTDLAAAFGAADEKSVRIANKLKGTPYYDMFLEMAGDNADMAMYSTDTLEAFAYVLERAVEECNREDEDIANFNAFDSIRTAIMAIPVRFVLKNVTVSTLEGSTTEIPYTVKIDRTERPRYFGVENVSKYIYSLAIASLGEVDVPWWLNILGAPDDPTGYEDAVRYVQAVEREIAAFAAQSATGNTTFRAWIEKASGEIASPDEYTITCNNDTAQNNDGELTFTGPGFIEVTPNTNEDGTLHIEMTEDGETTETEYVIDVVEQHTCHSDTWEIAVAPNGQAPGFRVKRCDICSDIIDIEEFGACTEHNFGEWVTEKAASQTENGIKYAECSDCGFKKYETVYFDNGNDGNDDDDDDDGQTMVSGDANGDGQLNLKDLLRLTKYFSGWDVEVNEYLADVTGEGQLDRQDLLRLAKYLTGWDVTLAAKGTLVDPPYIPGVPGPNLPIYPEIVGHDYRIIISSYEEKSGSTTKNYVELFNLTDSSTEIVPASSTLVAAGIANNKIVEVREDGKAYAIAMIGNAFSDNVIFKKTFTTATANYDRSTNFIIFSGDPNVYVVTDDTTIVYYEASNGEKEVADVSILTTKDNTYNDKFNDYDASADGSYAGQIGAFEIYLVAKDDINYLDGIVKSVKNIVVAPVGVVNGSYNGNGGNNTGNDNGNAGDDGNYDSNEEGWSGIYKP
ncbi:MAG: hypothetical protein IKV97_00400, partial [Clostridia bacterium]|nr:hypothetical protein [Clostridia bacterium]